MAQRQVRGIVPGLLDQPSPGYLSLNYLEDFPPQGKITASGLITVPIAGDPVGAQGDPIVQGVRGKYGLDPVNVLATDTRQASDQGTGTTPFPWLLAVALAAVAVL